MPIYIKQKVDACFPKNLAGILLSEKTWKNIEDNYAIFESKLFDMQNLTVSAYLRLVRT